MAEIKRKSVPAKKPVDPSEDEDLELLTSMSKEMTASLKKGAGFFITENTIEDLNVEFFKTGVPQLDYIMGGSKHPGVPLGRIIEISGGEGSGKTTLSHFMLGKFQEALKGLTLIADTEQVCNPETMCKNLNTKKMVLCQPLTMEETFGAMDKFVELTNKKNNGRPIGIVYDSIAGSSTEAELKGDYGDLQVASMARVLAKGLRKFNGVINEKRILAIFINQLRDKMNAQAFGEQSDTPGGRSMKFWASIRIWSTRISFIKDSADNKIGQIVKLETKKNKVAPPHKVFEIELLYNEDDYMIDHAGCNLNWCKDHNLIPFSAGFFEFEGTKYRKADLKKLMLSDQSVYDKILELSYSVKDA